MSLTATAYPEGFPNNNNLRKYVWQIDLKGGSNSKVGWYTIICCDITIAVENGIIFVHAPTQTQFNPELRQVMYYWFVINPQDLEELGFEDQVQFEEYLQTKHIDEPKWQDPNYLHNEFNMTGCLDWYPSCNKIPPILRFPPSVLETY